MDAGTAGKLGSNLKYVEAINVKLAEALISRADHQRRLSGLRERLVRNAKVQEGESAQEEPTLLLREVNEVLQQLTNLIQRINRTNSLVIVDGQKTLSDVLAERDVLGLKRNILNALVEETAIKLDRYSKSELKFYSTVNVRELQKEIDGIAQAYRELDTKIQSINWTIDLAE